MQSDAHYHGEHVWNFLATLVFVVVAYLCYVSITGLRGESIFQRLNYFDISIVSLATFRLVRFLTLDKIFGFVHDRCYVRAENGALVKTSGGLRRLLAELLECVWCTGIWAALACLTLYLTSALGVFIVLLLAIAGVGTAFHIFASMLTRVGQK